MPRCRVVRYSLPLYQRVPCDSQVWPISSGGLQLNAGVTLPSGVRYETQPLPIATNHRLLSVSNAPPSRKRPCGVPPRSANFSTGPTPAGSGGNPQGCTGPALVAPVCAGGGDGVCAGCCCCACAPAGPAASAISHSTAAVPMCLTIECHAC